MTNNSIKDLSKELKQNKSLTSVEKKLLSDLINTDLKNAKTQLTANVDKIEAILEKDLITKAPQKVKQLAKEYLEIQKKTKQIDNTLEQMGYNIDGYKNKLNVISCSYGTDGHPTLVQLNNTRRHKENQLENLARNYTLKIFSESGTMETLLKDLQKDITNLLKF